MATSDSENDDDMEFFVAFLQNRHRRIRTILIETEVIHS